MASCNLLGPPELYSSNHTKPPLMLFTHNLSPTSPSIGNPCFNFFFYVTAHTPRETLIELLVLAWKHDPLTTLKLICHLRSNRGSGKGDREGFYTAALWLHVNHPKTLACNVRCLAGFGYLKDLPEILVRILEGCNVRKRAKIDRWKSSIFWVRGKRMVRKDIINVARKRGLVSIKRRVIPSICAVSSSSKVSPRSKKTMDMARKAIFRYIYDLNYRFLYDRISDVFAKLLTSDLEFLKYSDTKKISLAAKWCPSLDSSYDRSTLLCESIARKIFPRSSDSEYMNLEEAHYAYRIRDRLRKQVLVPLREALQLPEVYMSSNKWSSVPYGRVGSVAMKNYSGIFTNHDPERFFEFEQQKLKEKLEQQKRKDRKGKITLLPHEIYARIKVEDTQLSYAAELQWQTMERIANMDGDDFSRELILKEIRNRSMISADEKKIIEDRRISKAAENLWQEIVEDLQKKGRFKDSIAICDSRCVCDCISRVCISLGLLISELSEEPWKGNIITFRKEPKLHNVRGNTLREKKKVIQDNDWGINFPRIFDKILQIAVKEKLCAEKMIKRVYVFSDMELDKASMYTWEADYIAIWCKFKKYGYGSVLPKIVFWNFEEVIGMPVIRTWSNVVLVNGHSKNLMRLFLEGNIFNPIVSMENAICGEEFEKLVVCD